VLSVIRFSDLDEAIRINNEVEYGLSSAIYTNDVRASFRAMVELDNGITYVNAPTIGAEAHLPFGGVKKTGNGHREGGWEVYEFYSETKVCYVDYSGRLQRAQIDTYALGVFASGHRRQVGECQADYQAYVAWRVRLDAFVSAGGAARSVMAPAPPLTRAGDLHWSACYADRFGHGAVAAGSDRRPRADLGRIAEAAIREFAPGLQLADLRTGSKCAPLLTLRRRIIAHALEAGYAGCQVGRFLRVSSSTVSRVAVALRDAAC
jgi:hypothetical protein